MKKRPWLEQKITPVAQAVTEERKFSTCGAKDYILRQKEHRIYFNWEDDYVQYHKECQERKENYARIMCALRG
jgi:hypothetical protein